MRRPSLIPTPSSLGALGVAASTDHQTLPDVLPVATRPPLTPTPSEPESTTTKTTTKGFQGLPRKEGSVGVVVRVRPLLPKEIAANASSCVEHEANMVHLPSSQKTFTFDQVFPSNASQIELYEEALEPLMDPFLQGFNVTVIAYGQTGAGKTFTMGNAGSTASLASRIYSQPQPEPQDNDGSERADTLESHEGLIPRFLHQLFARLQEDASASSNQVSVSFLEIYGEEIHDLLHSSRLPKDTLDNLQLRESKNGVWVQGLTEVKVSSRKEAMEQMRYGRCIGWKQQNSVYVSVEFLLQTMCDSDAAVLLKISACVSPAESNAHETLNTLQYANRAKNIQNKAVKNVDSRSAELLGLKALNDILRRELVRARFLSSPELDPEQLEGAIDTLMKEPMVSTYLKKLESLAASNNGVGLSAMSKMFSTLSSPGGSSLPDMLASYSGKTGSESQYSDTDIMSESGSSVAMMEDHLEEINESDQCSLKQLCNTAELIRLLLEMQELTQQLTQARAAADAKIAEIDAQLPKKRAILQAYEAAVQNMATWQGSSTTPAEDTKLKMVASKKLEGMRAKISDLGRQKQSEECAYQEYHSRIGKLLKQKHDRVQQIRNTEDSKESEGATNPIDVLLQVSEIKRRFRIKELMDIGRALEQEEKRRASYMDEDGENMAFMTGLSARSSDRYPQVDDIFQQIREDIQIALTTEDLQASLLKVLRERAQIVEDIMIGWKNQSEPAALTEQEFMMANEVKLRTCEDSIRQLGEALRSLPQPSRRISRYVESVTSIDVARSLIRRLIDECHGHKRSYLAYFNDGKSEDDGYHSEKAPPIIDRNDQELSESYELRLREITQKHEAELVSALKMVCAYSTTHSAPQDTNQLSFLTLKLSDAETRILSLEDKERENEKIVSAKDEELESLREVVNQLRSNLESSKMKEEAYQMMDRCQTIWRELGLDPNDQADKFRDINALLMKKCSEELEGLEAAREKLQERIDTAYSSVKRMEAILDVTNPIDVALLQSGSGKTLLEQERYLQERRSKLEDKLLQRIGSRSRGLQSILDLVGELGVEAADDFRHVRDEVAGIDLKDVREIQGFFEVWNQSNRTVDSFLEGGCTATHLSETSLQRDGQLLNALLREKSKRIAEVEEAVHNVRSLIQELDLSQEEIFALVRHVDKESILKNSSESDKLADLVSWIMQKGGHLSVNLRGLESLLLIRDALTEVYDGRSNAISFLFSTLDEARKLTETVLTNAGLQQFLPMTSADNQSSEAKEYGCYQRSLVAGFDKLTALGEPVERVIRLLLFSMNDDFSAFGIESETQRVSFLLGSDDRTDNPKRKVLEKYIMTRSEPTEVGSNTRVVNPQDSFLSDLDPAFADFGHYFSASFGRDQLNRLKESSADIVVISDTIQSAQKRLDSLQKIMKLFGEISEFKKKIAEFEAGASKKDRLFGSSLRLLEEERFRKMAAKRYPNLLTALRKEVEKWVRNEGGEFDLSILGQEMKNLLVDMMNTDTGLMHLDLGMMDATRTSARRMSKSNGTSGPASGPAALPSAPPVTSSQQGSTLPRSRPGSALSREASSKKRLVSDQH
ncbi:hypothetical protein Poli38472_009340 [Pythium oligandrum]|uniref:Kinesin motor domain-containing protein n=1 Tax=Pythium oligandrum TaxID=41045 RepID=A0A8K1FP11_PYTOL|nr:hypothetical protein Poli38472_009340 [Pythium oligandrum]|eukprot:TMW65173.1 hypothetical protein Poli38472_009340 [Pythium oligandrum]